MANKSKNRHSKINTKGRNTGESRHVRLYHSMLKSPAWKYLSPVAFKLLVAVWSRYNGINNGKISFSVREGGDELNISKNTAHKAFKELEEKGFLKARRRGSFDWKVSMSGKGKGHATLWEITALPFGDQGNQLASKEFMRWRKDSSKTKSRSQ